MHIVIHLVFLVFLYAVPFAALSSFSCHRIDSPNPTWKLCVRRKKSMLQFSVKPLVNTKVQSPASLTIGFPKENGVDFFKIIKLSNGTVELKSAYLAVLAGWDLRKVLNTTGISKQPEIVKKHMACKYLPRKSQLLVFITCKLSGASVKYLTSKKLVVWYSFGRLVKYDNDLTNVGKNLRQNHNTSYFIFNATFHPVKVKEDAGSTAMKLLRNYGKSMAIIVCISFLLTAVITITICFCCKKGIPVTTPKEKDVSVSFYRDNGEVEGESEDSENDEKVAFIRNNNSRNSNV